MERPAISPHGPSAQVCAPRDLSPPPSASPTLRPETPAVLRAARMITSASGVLRAEEEAQQDKVGAASNDVPDVGGVDEPCTPASPLFTAQDVQPIPLFRMRHGTAAQRSWWQRRGRTARLSAPPTSSAPWRPSPGNSLPPPPPSWCSGGLRLSRSHPPMSVGLPQIYGRILPESMYR